MLCIVPSKASKAGSFSSIVVIYICNKLIPVKNWNV